MHRPAFFLLIAIVLLTIPSGCQTAPDSAGAAALLDQDVDIAIARFQNEDSGMSWFFDRAYGYAVFPKVGKGALGIGGAFGRGQLYEQGRMVGYCDLTQGTVGLQVGGQEYSEIIFFEYKEAFDYFKTGNLAFAAQASAVAVSEGASTDAKYDRGVAVFSLARGGLMLEASLGGQKFRYEPVQADVPAPTGAADASGS